MVHIVTLNQASCSSLYLEASSVLAMSPYGNFSAALFCFKCPGSLNQGPPVTITFLCFSLRRDFSGPGPSLGLSAALGLSFVWSSIEVGGKKIVWSGRSGMNGDFVATFSLLSLN